MNAVERRNEIIDDMVFREKHGYSLIVTSETQDRIKSSEAIPPTLPMEAHLVYTTTDGATFTDAVEAKVHARNLLLIRWLREKIDTESISDTFHRDALSWLARNPDEAVDMFYALSLT